MTEITVIPFNKITGIEIQCPCGQVVVVASSAPKAIRPACLACGKDTLADACVAADAFKQFYRSAGAFVNTPPHATITQPHERTISFRISADAPVNS
jgi:hypothetical protein